MIEDWLIYLDVWVDLGIEENEKSEGNDSDGDEPEPVEVDRVVGVGPQLGRLQDWDQLCVIPVNVVDY